MTAETASHDSKSARPFRDLLGVRGSFAPRRSSGVLGLLALLASFCLLAAAAPRAQAQDWGDEGEDWGAPAEPARPAPASTRRDDGSRGFSVRTGLGFTADPTTFLVNFEVPYSFERWIALGPMLQFGIEGDDLLVMPTANVTLKVPDLPGRSFDRVIPYAFGGLGFAYIERHHRGQDREGAGFLIDAGFGVEYQVSEKVFFGSQMTFNFLPQKTQGERFVYSWQMAGIRFAF